jgi:DNA-binding NarL/FixJ family response regulator
MIMLFKKTTLKCAVLSHNTMPQMSQVLRERAIGMLTAGMSTRAVAREFYVNFSTINHLQVVLDNLAVRPTGLKTSDHIKPRQPRTSTSGFFTYGII